ncbi:hypothetical protein CI610_03683 [invertebrate metagenome]|uniref:Uncharacterized protein n=1 Tax=invertebrate metagenome TaxID=1711999 RepID=A0A2H9T2F9_9ZZZZ
MVFVRRTSTLLSPETEHHPMGPHELLAGKMFLDIAGTCHFKTPSFRCGLVTSP